MANKVKITDQNGVQVFPITHVSAVIDANGNSVEQVLGAQTDLIQQAQMEVGAVPSDLVPTKESTNWVTSGGVYDATSIEGDSGFNPGNETPSTGGNLVLTVGSHSISGSIKKTLTSDTQTAIPYTDFKAGKTYRLSFDYVAQFTFGVTIRKGENVVMLTTGSISAGSGSVSVEATFDADSVYLSVFAKSGSQKDQTVTLTNLYVYEVTSVKDKVLSLESDFQHERHDNEILVAASDAPVGVKNIADYVCTGTNDEVVIQNAINALISSNKGCVRLSKGTFNIDAFPNALTTDEGSTYTAIAIPNDVTFSEINIRGNSSKATKIVVTQTARNSIVANTKYKVIGGKDFLYSYSTKSWLRLSDLEIDLGSNQFPIVCVDLSLINRAMCERLRFFATNLAKFDPAWQRPVEGCVGLRMTSGSNGGMENDYRNILAWGFYESFQVGGESVLCLNLCSINAVYGYTFGNYHWQDSFNHKIVMIGIADERMENLPLFAESGYASSDGNANNTPFEVVLLGYSTEFIAPVWSNNAVGYATESHPGSYCGVITYTHETAVRANQVNIPFWAAGMGKNFKTSNSAQLEQATKAVIKTYAPNYNQIIYCTDLQKPLICTEPSTKEWRDFTGTIVSLD